MARRRDRVAAAAVSVADTASWSCALLLIAFILVSSMRSGGGDVDGEMDSVRGRKFGERACDEIYVVGEGETLNTISEKCGDPYIVEENPHIHDPDDVFPGLVIKITPTKPR